MSAKTKWPTWKQYKEMGIAGAQFVFTTDGCTHVPDFTFVECCHEHDYNYTTHRISRKRADARLKRCMTKKGYKLLPTIYWLGARIFGYRHWKRKQDSKSVVQLQNLKGKFDETENRSTP